LAARPGRGVWETPEWLTWENTWKLELAKRGVTPDMLEPLGDPRKPLAVEATPPALRRCSGKIDWTDGRSAILDALLRLVRDIDGAARSTS
jgi:hypothetical protein